MAAAIVRAGSHRIAQVSRIFCALFVFVVAPIGAAVIVSALLLFGVRPAAVFAPGWAILALLRSCGIHPRNAVGVITTAGLWWALLVLLATLREWLRSDGAPPDS